MEQLEKLKEFRELGLGEKVLKVLSKKGYESPTSYTYTKINNTSTVKK